MAVDYRTHLRDDRTLSGAGLNRGQMKRSWQDGIEDMEKARGLRHPGLDPRWREALTWGDVGRMLGYVLGPMDEEEMNRLYAKAAAWGRENDAWTRTRDTA